jgi:hypothetical protein
MSAIAVLDSAIGQLHIYDIKAFGSLVESLAKSPTMLHVGHRAEQQILVDGFTIEQWAAYGRHKAAIASKVCKDNGRLKAMLDSMSHRRGKLVTNSADERACDDDDPLVSNDPWRGCSFPPSASASEPPCLSLWSSWNRSLNDSDVDDFCDVKINLLQNTSHGDQSADDEGGKKDVITAPAADRTSLQGDWRPLPCAAWGHMYERFANTPKDVQLVTAQEIDGLRRTWCTRRGQPGPLNESRGLDPKVPLLVPFRIDSTSGFYVARMLPNCTCQELLEKISNYLGIDVDTFRLRNPHGNGYYSVIQGECRLHNYPHDKLELIRV